MQTVTDGAISAIKNVLSGVSDMNETCPDRGGGGGAVGGDTENRPQCGAGGGRYPRGRLEHLMDITAASTETGRALAQVRAPPLTSQSASLQREVGAFLNSIKVS